MSEVQFLRDIYKGFSPPAKCRSSDLKTYAIHLSMHTVYEHSCLSQWHTVKIHLTRDISP